MRGVNGSRRLLGREGAFLACALILAGALALTGCGGSSSGAGESGGTTAGSSAGSREEAAPSVNRTGIKPEEAATTVHLSWRDCDQLGAALTKRTGRTIYISAEPRPPRSGCRLQGHGIDVTITLDTSYGAHKRYFNRVVETQQFGAPDQAKMPHPVPGVGEPGAYGQSAQWIPAIGTLLAVRGNRWITMSYAAAGQSRPERKDAAAALAIRAFRLTGR